MRRVEKAKEARSIYWDVPLGDKPTPSETRNVPVNARQVDHTLAASQPATEGPEEVAGPAEPETSSPPTATAPQQAQIYTEAQTPVEATTTQTPTAAWL